jgi:hypothetical protein
MKKTVMTYVVFSLAILLSSHANAEQQKTLGQWQVHYNAFNSTFLSPAIATRYDVTRSASKGVLNIAVLDKDTLTSQSPGVSGQVVNPLGQVQQLAFQHINEGDAAYYIAQFDFTNAETLRFSIQVGKNQTLKFNQEFWLND